MHSLPPWPQLCSATFPCVQQPVIPYQLYHQAIEAAKGTKGQAEKSVIAHLPAVHYNVFFYLVSFVRFMLEQAETQVCRCTPTYHFGDNTWLPVSSAQRQGV